MFFIVILFLTTVSIAGTAAFFSVYGLAQLFQGMAVAVMIMGASLEAGKLVAASFLYRYWDRLGWMLRSYLSLAVFMLMVITSVGIFGMLSQGYQADTLPLKQVEGSIELLNKEHVQLTERKRAIDQQISLLPTNVVKGRQSLMKTFDAELSVINNRLPIINAEIQKLNTQLLHTQAHVGPIIYIAKVFGAEVDDATKYVILLLILVFDPLAVALTIGVNVALQLRRSDMQLVKADPAPVVHQQPEPIPVEPEPVLEVGPATEPESTEPPVVESTEPVTVDTTTADGPLEFHLTPEELKLIIADEVRRMTNKMVPSTDSGDTGGHVHELDKRNRIMAELRAHKTE